MIKNIEQEMMYVILAFILIINYVAIVADAITDSAICRKENVGWFYWHFWKWCRYYIPQLIVAYLLHYSGLFHFEIYYILGGIIYVCAGWILWKVFYESNILGALNELENY